MKSKVRVKTIFLITIGIIFALLTVSSVDRYFHIENSYFIDFDNKDLKNSEVSGRISLYINSGWVNLKNAGKCSGEGTYLDPYVIKDLEIDGGGAGSGIYIEGSTVYFKIVNCTIYNAGGGSDNAGITLLNVKNGQLINNDVTNNGGNGILLKFSHYNNITQNILSNNYIGIYLHYSENNIVSNNVFSGNTDNIKTVPNTANPFNYGNTTVIVVVAVVVIAIIFTSILIIYKKRTPRPEKIQYKKEYPVTRVTPKVKVKEIKPIPSPTSKIEDFVSKSIKTCPHCGKKLSLDAIFCIRCGKKIEEDKVIPSISDRIEEIQPSLSISERSKEKLIPEKLDLKVERTQPVPLIKEKIEEKKLTEDSLTRVKEKQPVLPDSDEKEEKIKVIPQFCKFCKMKLNKKATYCPQCGTRVKKK
jgi:parallel beta-helix repeat protein